jgi:hypothetical protein
VDEIRRLFQIACDQLAVLVVFFGGVLRCRRYFYPPAPEGGPAERAQNSPV